MPSFDKQTLLQDRAVLQKRHDYLTLLVSEAGIEQGNIETQMQHIDRVVAYLDGNGLPAVPILPAVADFNASVVVPPTDPPTIGLSWTQTLGAQKYLIYVALLPDYSDAELLTTILTGDTVAYDHTDRVEGVTYYYRIIATAEAHGNSPASDTSTTVLQTLEQPETFTLTPGDTQITGAWDAVSNADKYDLYRHTVDLFSDAVLVQQLYTESFADTELVNGTTYYYWLIPTAPLFNDGPAATANETPAP